MPSDNAQLFSPKRVFFLGAGTSALAGVPTFGNFYEIAKDICKNNLADAEKKKLFEDVLKHWHKNFRCELAGIQSYVCSPNLMVLDKD